MEKKSVTIGKVNFDSKWFSAGVLIIVLGCSFIFGYIGHEFYSEGLLNIESLGFWLGIANFGFITYAVIYFKNKRGLTWANIGLSKPGRWWQPILVIAGTYGAIMLFSMYVRPLILELGSPPTFEHLLGIRQNLSRFIFSLVVVWITAAFLEELIFRAFLINVLDELFGSAIVSVAVSAIIFGLLHAYQGITGILTTGSIGLIFGIAYILNGKRIWALVIIHGVIDTIGLYSIYQMPL
jgi:membrane protease YdiL (CAAX protease family)